MNRRSRAVVPATRFQKNLVAREAPHTAASAPSGMVASHRRNKPAGSEMRAP